VLKHPVRSLASSRVQGRSQRGASLIEVLVASVVLTVGMLSMAWQHAVSLKYDKMSQFRSIATQLGSAFADRIRANPGAAGNYVYVAAYAPNVAPPTAAKLCDRVVCNGLEMAAFDLMEFRNAARLNLPDGGLLITQDPADARAMTVWMLWRDPQAIDTANAAASFSGLCPPAVGQVTPMPQCMPLRLML
jgi:type IV pilus assembly protein PilV